MLILLSPAKTLDDTAWAGDLPTTEPQLERDISVLRNRVKKLSPRSLSRLMGLSQPLAELNHERFQAMREEYTAQNSRPALLAFQGDVYRSLDVGSLSPDDLEWAQEHVRILSGFYGLLRPLDRMQPYRLEMGTRLSNTRGKSLYQFWGGRLADLLNQEQADGDDAAILNLASAEYVKAVPRKRLEAPMVTAVFQEVRQGEPKTIGFLAKKARGLMARYAIRNRVDRPEAVKSFAEEGYSFRPELSEDDRFVFTRAG